MLQPSRSDLIYCVISKSILHCNEVLRNKAIKDLLNTLLREQNCEPYLCKIRRICIRDCRKHTRLIVRQQNSLVLSARDDLKNSFWVPEFHKSLRMKFDDKLTNSL